MEFLILALISVFAFFLVRFAAPAAILLLELVSAVAQSIARDAKPVRGTKAHRNLAYGSRRDLAQQGHLSNKR